MPDMSVLLDFIKDNNVSNDEVERELDNLNLKDLDIPATVSVESTLVEVNQLTNQLYALHNKNKRDPIPMAKIISLLELKTKLTGMMSIKPDVQAIIDAEINAYKRRFLMIVKECLDNSDMEMIVKRLAVEGL